MADGTSSILCVMKQPEFSAREHYLEEGDSLEEEELQENSTELAEITTQGDEPQAGQSSTADAYSATHSSPGSVA